MKILAPVSIVSFISLVASACGSTSGIAIPGTPQAIPPGIVEITVVSAEIRGQMANGEQWDTGDARSNVLPPVIERYLALHPELTETATTVGIPIEDDHLGRRASESKAADPVVVMQIGEHVYRSPIRPRSFQPSWDFTFRFASPVTVHQTQSMSSVRVYVVDYDGPDSYDAIGATVIPLSTLVSRPIQTLGPFGAVDKLIIQARTVPEVERKSTDEGTRIAIPGNARWTDTAIKIVAGQRVHIRAADEVCLTTDDSRCIGPQGFGTPHRVNLPGFENSSHGALVGALGDTRFVVGRELRMVAPATGILRLGVNDSDSDNNRAAFSVHVVIQPASSTMHSE